MTITLSIGEVRGLRCIRAKAVITPSKKKGIPRRYQMTKTVKTVAPNFAVDEMRASFEANAKRWETRILAQIEREKLGIPEPKEVQGEIQTPPSYYATLKAEGKV